MDILETEKKSIKSESKSLKKAIDELDSVSNKKLTSSEIEKNAE
jgi:hypothetical protein